MSKLKRQKKTITCSAVRLALTATLGLGAVITTALVTTGGTSIGSDAMAAPSKGAPVYATAAGIKLGDFARADSGVKLLVGIFNRLGNEPQLALKNDNRLLASSKQVSADGNAQEQLLASSNLPGGATNFQNSRNQFSNSMNNQNYTDPALAIRPRAVARLQASDKLFAIKGITLAALPEKKSRADNKSGFAGGAAPAAEYDRKNEEESAGGARRARESQPISRARDEVPMKMILGSTVTSAPQGDKDYVKEFGKANYSASNAAPASPSAAAAGLSSGRLLANSKTSSGGQSSFGSMRQRPAQRGINIIDEPLGLDRRLAQERAQGAAAQAAQDDSRVAEISNGIIRPTEQPGLFKYVREHMKESSKDAPPPPIAAPAGSFSSDAMSDMAVAKVRKKEKAAAIVSDNEISLEGQQEGAPLQVAFLPPSTVHGINGLPLGASENETAAFFKNRGNLARTVISGWKVWTLFDRNQTPLLQVYLRNGRTEAFRIFSQSYVPAGLGVSISDELPSMKGKFGEPAFILEEPGAKTQTRPIVAKNYVYPVSQVSFQLVRTGPGSSPQVLSLLLFRYL